MYMNSAKCNRNIPEDDNSLPLTDMEILNQEVTCDFIEDVMMNKIDADGFVQSHQSTSPIADFLGRFGADPLEKGVTAAQWFGLVFTGSAAAAMGFFAYNLHKQIADVAGSEGLINNNEGTLA